MAGGTVSRTLHFALHRRSLDLQNADGGAKTPAAALQLKPGVWMGALIPKRWAKRAVTRNAIKRQIYTVSAAVPLPQVAHVVRLRTTFDRKQFVSASSDALKTAVQGELQQLFERAAVSQSGSSADGCAP